MSRIYKFRNIYFGKDSLVKLFANKTHLENHVDYDAAASAFLLDVSDFTNTNALLSHYAIVDKNMYRPILIEWNLKTIYGRLMILKQLHGPNNTKMLLAKFENSIEENPNPNFVKYLAGQYAKAITIEKGLHQVYNFLIQRIYTLKLSGIRKSLEEVKRLDAVYR